MSQPDESAISDSTTGTILTGALILSTAVLGVWAQQGPGFDWDKGIAEWIRNTLPGLKQLAALMTWPMKSKWPFASAVMLLTVILCAGHKRKAAVFLLSAVSGGMLAEWALLDLPLPRPPLMPTLLYGTLLGGLSMGLHPFTGASTHKWLWSITAIFCLLSGIAAIGAGAAPSAWLISVLAAAAWILLLDQITR